MKPAPCKRSAQECHYKATSHVACQASLCLPHSSASKKVHTAYLVQMQMSLNDISRAALHSNSWDFIQ